jgi:hypothetical protein
MAIDRLPPVEVVPPPPRVTPPTMQRAREEKLPWPAALLLLALVTFAGGFAAGRWSAPKPPPAHAQGIATDFRELSQAAERPAIKAQVELIKAAAEAGGMIELRESPSRAGLVLIVGKRVLCNTSDPPAKAALWREALAEARRTGLIEQSGSDAHKIGVSTMEYSYWRLTSAAYQLIEAAGGAISESPGRADGLEGLERASAQWREEWKKDAAFKQREDIQRREKGQ